MPPSKPSSAPEPGPLPAHWEGWPCLDLVNTVRRDHRGRPGVIDRLRTPAWREAFLSHWDLFPDRAPGPAEVAALAALRELLSRLLADFARGEPASPDSLRALNGILAGAALRRRLEPAAAGLAVRLAPGVRDWSWVLAEIAASAAHLLAEAEPARLKACANEACGWLFYDASRNRSRRWCVGGICGNLVHVRRHRLRRSPA